MDVTLAQLSQRQTATGSWLSSVCTVSCLHPRNVRLAGNAGGKMTDNRTLHNKMSPSGHLSHELAPEAAHDDKVFFFF